MMKATKPIYLKTSNGLTIYVEHIKHTKETIVSIWSKETPEDQTIIDLLIDEDHRPTVYRPEEEQKNTCKNCDNPVNKNLIGKFCSKFCRSEYYGE